MCGRLNVIDDQGVIDLCEVLGIAIWPKPPHPDQGESHLQTNRFVRATDTVSIIHENQGQRKLAKATWWLLLDKTPEGFKPSKYTSFNTRYDKLNVPRSAGYQAFRTSRCIIPASGFGETEGKGAQAIYHDFSALTGQALAFGGLYREWIHPVTGEVTLSCSIITLPPHEKVAPYHSKSCPLILPQHDETMALWLDSSISKIDIFRDLMLPGLPQDLRVQRVEKPSKPVAIGEPKRLEKD